jgi:DNA-binding NarL/FixJ family response regulator
MQHTFLLVGSREESPSFYNLTRALTALGELQILPQEEAMEKIRGFKYSMIIIDAAILGSKMQLIPQIRTEQPQARIVVLTASPTWRRAREVLKVGAMDYLTKSLSEQEYLDAFRGILDQTLLP